VQNHVDKTVSDRIGASFPVPWRWAAGLQSLHKRTVGRGKPEVPHLVRHDPASGVVRGGSHFTVFDFRLKNQ
jgi:hypothetical protein